MTDHRPQYGEYATPEEQRRLAGLPPEDAVPAPAPVAAPMTPASDRPAARPWDRILTFALLAYGVINVVMSALSYLDLATLMNESMRILGIEGEFTNFEQAKVWGTVAAAVLVVGWAVTAWASIRRLRSGRITWWVPLVGAAVTFLVASFCIAVPMMGDPAFTAFVDGRS